MSRSKRHRAGPAAFTVAHRACAASTVSIQTPSSGPCSVESAQQALDLGLSRSKRHRAGPAASRDNTPRISRTCPPECERLVQTVLRRRVVGLSDSGKTPRTPRYSHAWRIASGSRLWRTTSALAELAWPVRIVYTSRPDGTNNHVARGEARVVTAGVLFVRHRARPLGGEEGSQLVRVARDA